MESCYCPSGWDGGGIAALLCSGTHSLLQYSCHFLIKFVVGFLFHKAVCLVHVTVSFAEINESNMQPRFSVSAEPQVHFFGGETRGRISPPKFTLLAC